jgi:transposase-like protein
MSCPYCDSENVKRINTSFPREFECKDCHRDFIEEDFSEYA